MYYNIKYLQLQIFRKSSLPHLHYLLLALDKHIYSFDVEVVAFQCALSHSGVHGPRFIDRRSVLLSSDLRLGKLLEFRLQHQSPHFPCAPLLFVIHFQANYFQTSELFQPKFCLTHDCVFHSLIRRTLKILWVPYVHFTFCWLEERSTRERALMCSRLYTPCARRPQGWGEQRRCVIGSAKPYTDRLANAVPAMNEDRKRPCRRA